MAQSKALKRLLQNIAIDKYDDREEVLEAAKKEGFNSRQGTYVALAYAYQWYVMSINDPSYMMQKFQSSEIKVSDAEKKSMFLPTIKLIFDFTESQYYSRASEYALVLQYVHRMMDDDLYADSSEDPSIVITIIKEGEGIRKCIEKQRAHNNPPDKNEATQSEINNYLQKACEQVYQNKKSLSTIKIDSPANSNGFVLMMGRVDKNGDIDIVDVMNAGKEEIFNLTRDQALSDTSSLSDTLNMLGDTLGYLHVFGTKEEPIVTVEQGGDIIYLSLDKNEDASVVISAKPKEKNVLNGFKNRAHMAMKNKKWFKEKAQSRAHRQMYDLKENDKVKTSEMAYDLLNQAKEGSITTIHFNKMNAKTTEQVITKSIPSNDWVISADLSRSEIDDLYSWTKGWLGIKRPNAAARIIEITVNQNDLTFTTGVKSDDTDAEESDGSEDKQILISTGYNGNDKKYRVFGREFVKVIEQVWLNPNIANLTLRFPDKGLVEILAVVFKILCHSSKLYKKGMIYYDRNRI